MPNTRTEASLTAANASGRRSSKDSPFDILSLNSAVFERSWSSERAWNSGSSSLIISTTGINSFSSLSFLLPKMPFTSFPNMISFAITSWFSLFYVCFPLADISDHPGGTSYNVWLITEGIKELYGRKIKRFDTEPDISREVWVNNRGVWRMGVLAPVPARKLGKNSGKKWLNPTAPQIIVNLRC